MNKIVTTTVTLVVLAISISSAPLYAQAPIPKALVEAKTAYPVNDGASQGMIDDVAKELTRWGRFQLVDSQVASDITITVGGLKPYKGWPMTITNSRDGSQLWNGAQKRGITNKVSTDLVKKLHTLLEGKEK